MGKIVVASLLLLFIHLASLLPSCLAWPYCPCPTPRPKHHPKHPHPPKPPVGPPKPPPIVQPPLPPPTVSPPKPPKGQVPCPPPPPTVVPSPPPPPPQAPPTCPVDTLKLEACVDLLGGLVHIGIGQQAKATCCPLLQGLADLDAALCLCTTIRAKLLNINLLLPIALQLLVGCGLNPPPGYQCPNA